MKSCRRPLTASDREKSGGLKIRNEENNGASGDDFVQIIECQRRIRAASLWFEKQNLPDKSQRMRAAFLRGNKKFNAIGKEDQPDLVVVSNGAESEQDTRLPPPIRVLIAWCCRNFPMR